MIEEIRIIIVLPHIVVPMPGFHESEEETFGRRFRRGRETRADRGRGQETRAEQEIRAAIIRRGVASLPNATGSAHTLGPPHSVLPATFWYLRRVHARFLE